MSITKCVDCERRIDIDIEEAIYGDDGQCLCEDCNDNENEGDSMNILDDILNDKNVNNNLKKVMKGEPMSKMGELAMEQEKKYDGTEGLSDDQLKEQMNEGYVKHMGQFVLKKVRLELGYNQQQMADALGYTRKDIICGIENGNRTMSGVAVRCLEYLMEIKELKSDVRFLLNGIKV